MSSEHTRSGFPWGSVAYAVLAILLIGRAIRAFATGTMSIPFVTGAVTSTEQPGLFWGVLVALLVVGGCGLYALVDAVATWRRARAVG